MNSKVYIHELIDIIGANRARYMHHMTANWCPTAREERNMSCFGVWGTVGSTGRWPEVVNLWELEGWDGLPRRLLDEERQQQAVQGVRVAEAAAISDRWERGGSRSCAAGGHGAATLSS